MSTSLSDEPNASKTRSLCNDKHCIDMWHSVWTINRLRFTNNLSRYFVHTLKRLNWTCRLPGYHDLPFLDHKSRRRQKSSTETAANDSLSQEKLRLVFNRSTHSRRSTWSAICQAAGFDFNAELKLVYQKAGRATSCSDSSWEEGPGHVTGEGGSVLLWNNNYTLNVFHITRFIIYMS